jgi:hypothetical protein
VRSKAADRGTTNGAHSCARVMVVSGAVIGESSAYTAYRQKCRSNG